GGGPPAGTGAGCRVEDGDRLGGGAGVRGGMGPEAIRVLVAAVDGRVLPHTYVTDGQVVEISPVSGAATATAGDADSPLPVAGASVGPACLAGLLAEHTHTFRLRSRKTDSGELEMYEEETTPARDVLAAVLARPAAAVRGGRRAGVTPGRHAAAAARLRPGHRHLPGREGPP